MITAGTVESLPRAHWLVPCDECGRVFDFQDEADTAEWFYGHDCEA